MKECKFHWTINNFANYYNQKQLLWQQCQTTSNKKVSVFDTWLSKVQIIILSQALQCTKNNTLWPFVQKGCAPLHQTTAQVKLIPLHVTRNHGKLAACKVL